VAEAFYVKQFTDMNWCSCDRGEHDTTWLLSTAELVLHYNTEWFILLCSLKKHVFSKMLRAG